MSWQYEPAARACLCSARSRPCTVPTATKSTAMTGAAASGGGVCARTGFGPVLGPVCVVVPIVYQSPQRGDPAPRVYDGSLGENRHLWSQVTRVPCRGEAGDLMYQTNVAVPCVRRAGPVREVRGAAATECTDCR